MKIEKLISLLQKYPNRNVLVNGCNIQCITLQHGDVFLDNMSCEVLVEAMGVSDEIIWNGEE